MLAFDDTRWLTLNGGYRVPYDPRPALRMLESGSTMKDAWRELWEELHHQGDVDLASYAAVPHLVRVHVALQVRGQADWNTYGLLSVIEWERQSGNNPAVPSWLLDGYEQAWRDAGDLAITDMRSNSDAELCRCALSVLATSRGMKVAGRMIFNNSEDELRELGETML